MRQLGVQMILGQLYFEAVWFPCRPTNAYWRSACYLKSDKLLKYDCTWKIMTNKSEVPTSHYCDDPAYLSSISNNT